MERKLASIQTIDRLDPIPGKDRIMLATIMGWTVIVKKEDFKVGDKCVFFEINSVLPKDNPEFEFMARSKYRVKTMKMSGCLSQGLALPLSILGGDYYYIGQDVSEKLGVKKWEDAITEGSELLSNNIHRMPFPHWVPKTDEIRLQSALGVLNELKGKEYYITIKLDGCSATYTGNENWDGYHVASRRQSVKDGDNVWWEMSRKYDLQRIVELHNFQYAIQGEICGPGIQRNRMGLYSHELFVFDVWDTKHQCYLDYKTLMVFCGMHSLTTVPIKEHEEHFDYNLEQLIELAKGKYFNEHPQEGIVVRPTTHTYSHVLKDRLSFKVINNDFLLKTGE